MELFYGVPRDELREALPRRFGSRRWMARRLFRAVYVDGATSWADVPRLSSRARRWLEERYSLAMPTEVSRAPAGDGSHKVVFRLEGGSTAETVSMRRKSGKAASSRVLESLSRRARRVSPWQVARNLRPLDVAQHLASRLRPSEEPPRTLCLSSQVGCAMGCTFCYTGTKGLIRNLDAGEIVAQVVALSRSERVAGLVFMGMGEPLHNYDNVVRAIRVVRDRAGLALSGGNTHVSTSGLVPQMRRLAEEGLEVRLALSLNATTDEARQSIMPINKRWPIRDVVAAARHFTIRGRGPVMVEYVLLRDVNDSPEDAERLVGLLEGVDANVELIPFNEFDGTELRRPEETVIERFAAVLRAKNVSHHVRRSKGSEVGAACGQLGLSVDESMSRKRRLPVR